MSSLGERVKKFRNALSLKQTDLAGITGMSQGNISEIEADKKTFSYEAIVSLMGYLRDKNISIDWLLTGIGEIYINNNNLNETELEINANELKKDEILLIQNYRDLTENGKDEILGKSARMAAREDNKKLLTSMNIKNELECGNEIDSVG